MQSAPGRVPSRSLLWAQTSQALRPHAWRWRTTASLCNNCSHATQIQIAERWLLHFMAMQSVFTMMCNASQRSKHINVDLYVAGPACQPWSTAGKCQGHMRHKSKHRLFPSTPHHTSITNLASPMHTRSPTLYHSCIHAFPNTETPQIIPCIHSPKHPK